MSYDTSMWTHPQSAMMNRQITPFPFLKDLQL